MTRTELREQTETLYDAVSFPLGKFIREYSTRNSGLDSCSRYDRYAAAVYAAMAFLLHNGVITIADDVDPHDLPGALEDDAAAIVDEFFRAALARQDAQFSRGPRRDV